MKTYLSGGIEFAHNFGKNWRDDISDWIKSNLNHEVFNPSKESIVFFQNEFPGFKRAELKNMDIPEIRNIIGSLVNYEVSQIINEIDYVICLWDRSCYKGAGTQGELTIARYQDIPVFIVSEIDKSEIPSWIIGCSTEVFKNFDDLKVHLSNLFKDIP